MVKNGNFFLTTWIKFFVRYNIKSNIYVNNLNTNAANKQIK